MTQRPHRITLLYVTRALLAVGAVALGISCLAALDREGAQRENMATNSTTQEQTTPPEELRKATFGAGCFWCTEAIFEQLAGVLSVASGYSGGQTKTPSYKDVSTGSTGHAEVVQIDYDPTVLSYEQLLEVFWKSHDPTTLNRQGADVGTQYRSVIFFHDEEQRALAEHYKRTLDASAAFEQPIVTTIEPLRAFYSAEDYHQNYYDLNPRQPYCSIVIRPKIEKFRQVFKDKLKAPPIVSDSVTKPDAVSPSTEPAGE